MAMQESWVAEQSEAEGQGVTFRSIVLGLGLALLTILWNTYVEYIAHTGRINITHFPISICAPYTVLALGNAVLADTKCRGHWRRPNCWPCWAWGS
jgi:hypothetical protein